MMKKRDGYGLFILGMMTHPITAASAALGGQITFYGQIHEPPCTLVQQAPLTYALDCSTRQDLVDHVATPLATTHLEFIDGRSMLAVLRVDYR